MSEVKPITQPDTTTVVSEHLDLKVYFKPLTFIVILDLVVRILLCLLFFLNQIGLWWFVGIFVGSIIIAGIFNSNIESKFSKKLRDDIGETKLSRFRQVNIEYSIRETLPAIYALLGLVFSFWFFYEIIDPGRWYMYILVFYLGVCGLIPFILVPFFVVYPRSYDPVEFQVDKTIKQKKGDKEETVTKEVTSELAAELIEIRKTFNSEIQVDPVDVNDSQIARIESDLKNINTKVESYMLEGVLIGSLTFSGFLTIIASGISGDLSDLNKLRFGEMSSLFSDMSKFPDSLKSFATIENLFTIILFESLFCSVFFILVLALRMRFSSLSLKMDYLLRIMTIFNAKEEELINIALSGVTKTSVHEARLANISRKITEAISDANKLLKDIEPVAALMGLYRNIGLILFFMILITSGFFFSPQVALSVFFIAIGTWMFRVIETGGRREKINKLLRRHR